MTTAPRENRTLCWLVRIVAASAALELSYWLTPSSARRTQAQMVLVGEAMRRDADLPERPHARRKTVEEGA